MTNITACFDDFEGVDLVGRQVMALTPLHSFWWPSNSGTLSFRRCFTECFLQWVLENSLVPESDYMLRFLTRYIEILETGKISKSIKNMRQRKYGTHNSRPLCGSEMDLESQKIETKKCYSTSKIPKPTSEIDNLECENSDSDDDIGELYEWLQKVTTLESTNSSFSLNPSPHENKELGLESKSEFVDPSNQGELESTCPLKKVMHDSHANQGAQKSFCQNLKLDGDFVRKIWFVDGFQNTPSSRLCRLGSDDYPSFSSPPGTRKSWVSTYESRLMISKGTTGLRTWAASFVLADLMLNPGTRVDVSGALVLELGAGTGMLSLAALRAGSDFVLSTDVHPSVLRLLESNLEKFHQQTGMPAEKSGVAYYDITEAVQLESSCGPAEFLLQHVSNCQKNSMPSCSGTPTGLVDCNDYSSSHLKKPKPLVLMASDLAYDTNLIASLLDRIAFFLEMSGSGTVLSSGRKTLEIDSKCALTTNAKRRAYISSALRSERSERELEEGLVERGLHKAWVYDHEIRDFGKYYSSCTEDGKQNEKRVFRFPCDEVGVIVRVMEITTTTQNLNE